MRPSYTSGNSRQESRQRQRTPDWREFYKNGLPKEVIVIDDDDDEPPPSRAAPSRHAHNGSASERQDQNLAHYPSNGSVRHADKKRKTAAGSKAYDPVYHGQASNNAHGQTPQYVDDSPTTSVSTQRTASALTTTAGTSLGSNGSRKYNARAAPHDGVEIVGQKRKRTRKAAADEAKQREIETQGDAYSSYCPPPKPPIKAKEVFVHVAHDVRIVWSSSSRGSHCVILIALTELLLQTSKGR